MAKKTTVPVSSTFDKELFKRSVLYNVRTLYRKTMEEATDQQIFQAVSYAVKDIVVDDWMATHKEYEKKDVKTVYYLSMEFLMGRAMGNMIINLKQDKLVREVLDEMGVNLDVLCFNCSVDKLNSFFNREKRAGFTSVTHNQNDYLVEQFSSTLNNIEMSQGYRVKATRTNCRFHNQPFL